MIHLHVHDSIGSILDSTIKPYQLPLKAKELGMSAIGISNHGTMSSIIQFYQSCKEEGIKPIIGCEFYVCEDMNIRDTNSRYDHLLVIAKNNTGYKNLLKLSGIGYIEGFYYKPRIDLKMLEKHKEGLIVCTACLGGEIPRMILNNKPVSEIENRILQYKGMFENFYIEIQSADNKEQQNVNELLTQLSCKHNIPLVVTSDAHFLNKEDYELHGVFIKINQDRDNEVYQDCWIKSEEEVRQVLSRYLNMFRVNEAIANTHKIADMCNVEIELGKSYLPDFPIPKEFLNENDYLKHLANKGFISREIYKLPKYQRQQYIDRATFEFDIISKKFYSGYFLIVQDFLEECRKQNIYTGDGRGSADNSLICYLLHITNVDPIQYDLNFSRFLTMDRVELPDIDMDIQSSRKQDAVNILRQKYGYENVAQICTRQSLQAKAVIESVGKVLGIEYDEIVKIKKYIPDLTSLELALKKSHKLRDYKDKHPKLFDYAMKLEGLPRSTSVHAGGVVICPTSKQMNEFTALSLSKEKEIITQLEMHDIESVGLVKMDCLGISTLDVIADTLDLIYGEE